MESKHCYEDCPYTQYTPSVVLEEAAVALPLHLHWWMVLVDGLILVDDQHWWMVMVDGPVLLAVFLPVVCYKLAEPPQKDHTKFEEKLQYYMFYNSIYEGKDDTLCHLCPHVLTP